MGGEGEMRRRLSDKLRILADKLHEDGQKETSDRLHSAARKEEAARKSGCQAVIWHGPGHQSRTQCRRTDEHDVHEAQYGSTPFAVRWRGTEAMTGFFDEPPEMEE